MPKAVLTDAVDWKLIKANRYVEQDHRPGSVTVRKPHTRESAERAALLIVNAPVECVVGGYRSAVEKLVEGLGCVFLPLQGVSTVHFPAVKLVEKRYRELHLFPTRAPKGLRLRPLGPAYKG